MAPASIMQPLLVAGRWSLVAGRWSVVRGQQA
jgi:hypothetical protein